MKITFTEETTMPRPVEPLPLKEALAKWPGVPLVQTPSNGNYYTITPSKKASWLGGLGQGVADVSLKTGDEWIASINDRFFDSFSMFKFAPKDSPTAPPEPPRRSDLEALINESPVGTLIKCYFSSGNLSNYRILVTNAGLHGSSGKTGLVFYGGPSETTWTSTPSALARDFFSHTFAIMKGTITIKS